MLSLPQRCGHYGIIRNEEEMQMFALEGKDSQWSPRGLSKSTHLIIGIFPNCRSLHPFSETPTLSRGTSFNSCHSAASLPQRYVISRHLSTREIIQCDSRFYEIINRPLRNNLLNEQMREWIKGFQNSNLQEQGKRFSDIELSICPWGDGQTDNWPTHFMEFYTMIKGIGRENYIH